LNLEDLRQDKLFSIKAACLWNSSLDAAFYSPSQDGIRFVSLTVSSLLKDLSFIFFFYHFDKRKYAFLFPALGSKILIFNTECEYFWTLIYTDPSL
jgi:hypothetical protein